jgi:hypothetical protein
MEPTIEAVDFPTIWDRKGGPMPRVPLSSILPQQASKSFQVSCVLFLLVIGLVLFHRFFPADLEQVYRAIFLQWREEHPQAFWLSVGGGTVFLCVLMTTIVLKQALSSATRGLGALDEHLTQLDSSIATLREDIEQLQRRVGTLPQHSDAVQ